MNLFEYSIQDLQTAAVRDVDVPLPAEWLAQAFSDTELAPSPEREGRVQMRLMMSGRDVVVRGRAQAPMVMPCGRCLEPAQVQLDAELTWVLSPAPAATVGAPAPKTSAAKPAHKPRREPEEYQFTSEEADRDTYEGDQVVLDSLVREALLLEVPIFPLCSEACPGIAAAPTQEPADASVDEQTVDPRLAPLMAIRDKNKR